MNYKVIEATPEITKTQTMDSPEQTTDDDKSEASGWDALSAELDERLGASPESSDPGPDTEGPEAGTTREGSAEARSKEEFSPPTPEWRQRFEAKMDTLAEVFDGLDVPWFLDGATNISLYEGEQIRDHSDVDISIFEDDATTLQGYLRDRGYSIFCKPNDSEEQYVEVDAEHQNLKEYSQTGNLYLISYDEEGGPDRSRSKEFNLVDLHLQSRNENGDVVTDGGAVLPKEYFHPIPHERDNHGTIQLSHPAVVAFHKLHMNREKDSTDLRKLAPYLEKEDYDLLRNAIEQEANSEQARQRDEDIREKSAQVFDDMELGEEDPLNLEHKRGQGEISDSREDLVREWEGHFWTHPDLASDPANPDVRTFISSMAEYVSDNPQTDENSFVEQSLALLGSGARVETMRRKLTDLQEISPTNASAHTQANS